MTVLFHDIYNDPKIQARTRNEFLNYNDLLYADDTLLLTVDTKTMNSFLAAIEKESEYYNMKLNKEKCLTITMNGNSHTHFEDGTHLKNVLDAKYLGISLEERASNKPDLNARISSTLATITALKFFWTSSTKPKWKLLVFNAIAGSKILYGLESLQLSTADLNRLDAFQQRGLRRILGYLPTHLDRTATNQKVLDHARREMIRRRPKNGHQKELETFSNTIKKRSISLLGHIIRLPDNDPMKQITLRKEKPLYPAAKRVGRPKLNWAKQTFKAAWEAAKAIDTSTPGTSFTATAEQYENLIHTAKFRRPPFHTKNSIADSDLTTGVSSQGPLSTQTGVSPLGPLSTLTGVRPLGPLSTHTGASSLGPLSAHTGARPLGPLSTFPLDHRHSHQLANFTAGAPLAVRWTSTTSTGRSSTEAT